MPQQHNDDPDPSWFTAARAAILILTWTAAMLFLFYGDKIPWLNG